MTSDGTKWTTKFAHFMMACSGGQMCLLCCTLSGDFKSFMSAHRGIRYGAVRSKSLILNLQMFSGRKWWL